ncbi:MAG: hypothetical protein AAGD06_05510 [Acidobacteriota bacterium]
MARAARRILVVAILLIAAILLLEAWRRPSSILAEPGEEEGVAAELLTRPPPAWVDGLGDRAEAAGADPCLAAALLMVEGADHSRLETTVERSVVAAGRYIGFLHGYDLSLGDAQMKVSTAAWVASGFQDAQPIDALDDATWRRTTDALLGDGGRDLFLSYLGYLQKRRDVGISCCRPKGPTAADYVVLGTEYNAGVSSPGSSPGSAYGRLTSAVATHPDLRERLCR